MNFKRQDIFVKSTRRQNFMDITCNLQNSRDFKKNDGKKNIFQREKKRFLFPFFLLTPCAAVCYKKRNQRNSLKCLGKFAAHFQKNASKRVLLAIFFNPSGGHTNKYFSSLLLDGSRIQFFNANVGNDRMIATHRANTA